MAIIYFINFDSTIIMAKTRELLGHFNHPPYGHKEMLMSIRNRDWFRGFLAERKTAGDKVVILSENQQPSYVLDYLQLLLGDEYPGYENVIAVKEVVLVRDDDFIIQNSEDARAKMEAIDHCVADHFSHGNRMPENVVVIDWNMEVLKAAYEKNYRVVCTKPGTDLYMRVLHDIAESSATGFDPTKECKYRMGQGDALFENKHKKIPPAPPPVGNGLVIARSWETAPPAKPSKSNRYSCVPCYCFFGSAVKPIKTKEQSPLMVGDEAVHILKRKKDRRCGIF